jgi:hypothetical protein
MQTMAAVADDISKVHYAAAGLSVASMMLGLRVHFWSTTDDSDDAEEFKHIADSSADSDDDSDDDSSNSVHAADINNSDADMSSSTIDSTSTIVTVPSCFRALVTELIDFQADSTVARVMPFYIDGASTVMDQSGVVNVQTTPQFGVRGSNGQIAVAYSADCEAYFTDATLIEKVVVGKSQLVKVWSCIQFTYAESICTAVVCRAVCEAGRQRQRGEHGAVHVRAHLRRAQRELVTAAKQSGEYSAAFRTGIANLGLFGHTSSGSGSDSVCVAQNQALRSLAAAAVSQLQLQGTASIDSTAPDAAMVNMTRCRVLELLFERELKCEMNADDAEGREKLLQLFSDVSGGSPLVHFQVTDTYEAAKQQPLLHYTQHKDIITKAHDEYYLLCRPEPAVVKLGKQGNSTELYIDMHKLLVVYMTQLYTGELAYRRCAVTGRLVVVPVTLKVRSQVHSPLPWLRLTFHVPKFGTVNICCVIVLAAWLSGEQRVSTCSQNTLRRALYKITHKLNFWLRR